MTIKRTGLFVFLLSLFLFPAPALTGGVFEKIESELSRLLTVKARFEQEVPLPGTGVTRRATGHVYVSRSEGSLWDYESPTPQAYLILGDKVYFREGKEGEFRETRVPAEATRLFEVLLGGRGKLSDLMMAGRDKIDDSGRVELELIPRGEMERAAKKVVVLWDPRARVVEEVSVYSPAGLTNRVRFFDVEKNVPIPEVLFRIRK
ncbi:MAG: outer membrane lipoprotein carrier protein LolA [Deltaproteobacteria bacterium]|nr:MAG: outer membrane lipoprotein carrier protein LolA [Deltaproteobacteria bacterium]